MLLARGSAPTLAAHDRYRLRRRASSPLLVPVGNLIRLVREAESRNASVSWLWGAPKIHGELLKLGIEIGQASVAKYMARRRGPPSQGWKTFLRNRADGIVAMDLFGRADNCSIVC